ncbi:MAG: hypothetical protein JRI23_12825 [Deltaproteobacteria bacterium]|nr:hypothetical protein [Deltaproteobacteria bacterium]MBW2532598.1 hypothetical protein [Deltaproteobacteria bacterium]
MPCPAVPSIPRRPSWRAACQADLAALGSALLTLVLGCDGAPSTAPIGSARPQHDSAAAIPAEPVQGEVGSAPFVVRDARFRIDRRPGHEKVDILLSDAKSDHPCGALTPAEPTRVWLRRRGAGPLASGEIRIPLGADDGWSAHYQLRRDGRWKGSGHAAALLQLDVPDAGFTLQGKLSVCFADADRSCVAGTFRAHQCPDVLDRPVRGVGPTERPAELRRPEPTAAPR